MGGKTVLICVDGSDIAHAAFDYAMENICCKDDTVLVLTVPEYNVSMAALGSDWQKVCDDVKKNDAEIDGMCSKYMTVIRQKEYTGRTIKVPGGKAGEIIINTARQEGVSHIVMGSRGLSRFQRAFLGSVSNYVLNHTDVPVTIIPCKKLTA